MRRTNLIVAYKSLILSQCSWLLAEWTESAFRHRQTGGTASLIRIWLLKVAGFNEVNFNQPNLCGTHELIMKRLCGNGKYYHLT